jgi:hypothetical protein
MRQHTSAYVSIRVLAEEQRRVCARLERGIEALLH